VWGQNELQTGLSPWGKVTDNLNRRGITTATGGQWHAMQVYRVRQRLGLI